jgi:serine/threonine protein kinase
MQVLRVWKGAMHVLRWQSLSESAKSLLMGMLDYDPAKRLTAKQVEQTPPVHTGTSLWGRPGCPLLHALSPLARPTCGEMS